MFVISIDLDWAVEPLLKDTIKILNDRGIKATFFLTNPIDFGILHGHEIAIHPNFERFSEQEEVIRKTLDFLPTKKSKGSRSHRMYFNSPLLSIYEKFDIQYDSNFDIPVESLCQPFFFKGVDILEIPVFFADDTHFLTSSRFDLEGINLNDSGVKVFIFHPFHIFMNTNSNKFYQSHKPNYKNFEYLAKNRNSKGGIRDLFTNLLDHIKDHGIETKTMEQINEIWRSDRM